MKSTHEPTLAPPGAGIPMIERWVAGILLSLRRQRGTKESMREGFEIEREKIRGLLERVRSMSRGSDRKRVLIDRLRGLEESSRYWSVLMVLDHLRIVNNAIVDVVDALAKERVPPGEARTENVKPGVDPGDEIFSDYDNSCGRFLSLLAEVSNLRTSARFAHPWFGPMDAAGWSVLAGVHMGIHRKQMERIIDRLSAETPES